jgi:hypothetical protein
MEWFSGGISQTFRKVKVGKISLRVDFSLNLMENKKSKDIRFQ